jgi:hypothetical protein
MVLTLLPLFSTNLIIGRQDLKHRDAILHAIIQSLESKFFLGRHSRACISACFFPFSKPILIGLLDHQTTFSSPSDTAEYPAQLRPGWAT